MDATYVGDVLADDDNVVDTVVCVDTKDDDGVVVVVFNSCAIWNGAINTR